MARTYSMTAEENYDGTRVSYIAGLSSYAQVSIGTDQNYQGVQWDPVNRNLMYMYTEKIPTSPTTNTTGHTLWDGEIAIAPGAAINHSQDFNTSIGVKNIDSGVVTFYSTYNPANVVPAGVGGSDGTFRRYTEDFPASGDIYNGSGPGMTDPYTGNFWINSQSCQLYCFRKQDNYAMNISPLFPVIAATNIVKPVGFTNTGATSPWTFAREIARAPVLTTAPAYLYLIPREFTAAEIAADYLLNYATFTYPMTWDVTNWGDVNLYTGYNREVFDKAGNMYVFSCNPIGAKNFKLHKFSPPTSAPYGGPTVGGGFTDITPWSSTTGPNADAVGYSLSRNSGIYAPTDVRTSDIIPMYLPNTDDLVLIEKFFPAENTATSTDPALMSWSCTYVHNPAGTPTYDHHSAFVKGYMTSDWRTTDISGAAYSVLDAFELNSYLGQPDYLYDHDYTKRWFYFVCTRMTGGVSDGKPRIVMVEYNFLYGNAPTISQVVDEQGWDDTYSSYAPACDFYPPYSVSTGSAVASSMQTIFNNDTFTPLWDVGIHDPVTSTFWWSGGATDQLGSLAIFSRFSPTFYNRTKTGFVPNGTDIAATPPFMKLSFTGTDTSGDNEDDLVLRCWGYSLDGHDFYVLRVGGAETIVYDLTTGMWSEWASPGKSNWRAHVGQNWVGAATATMSRDFGSDVIAGDDSTGVLWMLDPTAGIDDNPNTGTTPFMRRVNSGIVLRGRDAVPCNAIQLTVSLGAPVLTGATMELRTSDDFGNTWVDQGEVMIDPGNYEQVIEYRSLGLMVQPGRIFEFTDEGAAVRISGADLR